MTRFLSESLGAKEPFFRLGLQRLETANGVPNHDIRLSNHIRQATKARLAALGLDPADTTPEELYHALQQRVKADDARLAKNLRRLAATYVSAEGEAVAGMVHALKQLPDSQRCYALKTSRVKTILRQLPPKKTMKQLGYRSLDSFLKHEPPFTIMAAARLFEGAAWQQRLLESYGKLKPSDFEERRISLVYPGSLRWRKLAPAVVNERQHNFVGVKELGAIVFLPLPDQAPAGSITASLSLALHELNAIRAAGTYLKLCQVRPDFGTLVQSIASDQPRLDSKLFDMPLNWHL